MNRSAMSPFSKSRIPPAALALAILLTLAAAASAAGKKVTVTIDGLKYSPATVEIEVGDTVVWENKDDRQHTVTAEDGSFDSGKLRTGKSYSKTFDKAGKYAYGSDPSPRTKGVVVVKEKAGGTKK
jgi:plastocyanin